MKKYDAYLDDNYKSTEVEFANIDGDTEAKIAWLWSDILDSRKIGVDDSFFKLGGNSLVLMQFHARLDKLFPGKVTIPDLFAYSTIRKLAEFIDSTGIDETKNQSLKSIILPSEYFQDELNDCGCLYYNFQIRGNLFNKLVAAAKIEEVPIKDMLIAIYLLLLAEAGGVKDIEMLAVLDNPDRVKGLNADFSNTEDFSKILNQLGSQIKQSLQQTTYNLRDIKKMKVDGAENSVLPLILLKELNIYSMELMDIFDIIFEIEVESNRVCFMLGFNADKLDEVKMEELVEKYVELVFQIVGRYDSISE